MASDFLSQEDIDSLLSSIEDETEEKSEAGNKSRGREVVGKVIKGVDYELTDFVPVYRSPVIKRENVVINPAGDFRSHPGKQVVWTLDEYLKKEKRSIVLN